MGVIDAIWALLSDGVVGVGDDALRYLGVEERGKGKNRFYWYCVL